MRPGEPPTADSVENLFEGMFFKHERYDLSSVGRMKFNKRAYPKNAEQFAPWMQKLQGHIDHNSDEGESILSKEDILAVIGILIELRNGRGEIDDIDAFQTLYSNDLDHGDFISQTLTTDEIPDQYEAKVAIYRMMRPGEPPTADSVENLFEGMFFKHERYDLSSVGSCLLYTSPSPRDRTRSRMPSSA